MNDHDLMDALRATCRVSDDELARGVDGYALSALREGITMTDRNQTSSVEAPRRGRRLGRRGLTAGAVAFVLVGGGAAYAVTQWADTPTLDALNCAQAVTLEGGDVHLTSGVDGRAASGDDVADCARIRADAGLPALVDPYAFVYGGTHFVVSRAGVPAQVLRDAKESLPSAEQSALLELEAAMDDWIQGPTYHCLTATQAQQYAEQTLSRVGLSGWSTSVVEDPDNPRPGPCASIVPFSDRRVVEVRAHHRPPVQEDPDGISAPVFAAARGLRSQVANTCVSLPEAKRIARSLVDDLDEVNAVPDEQAACTRVDMVVGGKIFVTLRGPSVARP